MPQLGPLDFDYERFPGVALRATHQKAPKGHTMLDRPKQLAKLGKYALDIGRHILNLVVLPRLLSESARAEAQGQISELDKAANALAAFLPLDNLDSHEEVETQGLADAVQAGFSAILNLLLYLLDEWEEPTDPQWYVDLFRDGKVIDPPQPLIDFVDPARRNMAFASWWVQGNNPLCVRGDSLATIEQAVGRLEPELYARVIKDDSPAQAGEEGRLFWVDFPTLLKGLEVGDFPVQKRLPKPCVVFAVRPGKPEDEPFVPVAIYDDSINKLVWSDVANPANLNAWIRAMLASLCANQLHHTWVSHFPRTHFVMEGIAVATLRELPQEHPLFWLLRTHIDGTLAFNETALSSFTTQSGADRLLMGSSLRTGHKLMIESLNGWKDFAFADDLDRRCVKSGQLPYYPYREDAELWLAAIHTFVGGIVDAAYPGDSDVRNDSHLQNWAGVLVKKRNWQEQGAELIGQAPTTKEQLKALLEKIIFTCTAYHAAVQVPLNDFDVSPLVAPGSLYPDNSIDPPVSMLARLGTSLFQLAFFYFGNIITGEAGEWVLKRGEQIPPKMQQPANDFTGTSLGRIFKSITDANNKKRKKAGAYKTLLPATVSRSVDI